MEAGGCGAWLRAAVKQRGPGLGKKGAGRRFGGQTAFACRAGQGGPRGAAAGGRLSRGAEAVLSPVIDGTVPEEINSQALAGGELGGCIHLKDT